jgi:hypothetical protein
MSHDTPIDREASMKLTPAGAARREAMLTELLGDLGRVHRARRVRRRAAVAASLAIVLTGATWAGMRAWLMPASSNRSIVIAPRSTESAPLEGGEIRPLIEIVHTDPGVLDRYRLRTTLRVERVDDAGLIRALEEIDRPAGLVRIDGEVRLTAAVTDAELRPERDPNGGL